MKRAWVGLVVLSLAAAGCDKPDEIYNKLPDDTDPDIFNGFQNSSVTYSGVKGWEDETLDYDPGIATTEVCSDTQIVENQMVMVNEPIIPMKGAGGLDMTGGEDWSGLTIEEAQTPDMLCQALYYGDGIAAWGDYYELIAFWDTQTRKIDDILTRSGYKGTILADGSGGPTFEWEINEAITKDGIPLSRGDGSARDPRTDDNLREMDRALIRKFRPSLDASSVDCIESGSCYIIMSGTLPVLVFMSVGQYVVLEPIEQHIVQLETSLKRPFRIGMGEATVSGTTLTVDGTAAAGIPSCNVTYGTDWADIESNCLGDDPMEMAQITSVYGYENINVQMGGILLYLERSGLATDEILPIEPTPQAGDKVAIASINAAYEGDFSMPYSEVLDYFKVSLDAAIRDRVALDPTDPTGVERLKTPDDPMLPADVQARYTDRLRPGGIYAAFCTEDENGDTIYDSCQWDTAGRPTLPLVRTLQDYVSQALGSAITPKLADPTFYVQHFQRGMGQYFNGGVALGDDEINFRPNSSRPDTILATMLVTSGTERYTISLYYGGNDDRIHFIDFANTATRMEEVLYQDASLPTPTDPGRDTFTFTHLLSSPRMGLGAQGTIEVAELVPETRRAVLDITMGSSSSTQVLASYMEASSITGYYIPLEGPHVQFQQADWFSLYGGTIGAGFYLAPVSATSDEKEVVAITGSAFFGDVYVCGFPTRIGAYADELLEEIEEADYPCEMIVRRSENREFITAIYDMDSQTAVFVTNNMIDQVFAWLR